MKTKHKRNIRTVENNTETKVRDNQYPSATMLVDICFQDYQRLQDEYNKIYDKTNIAIAFVSTILTASIGSFDISVLSKITITKLWRQGLGSFDILCYIAGMVSLIIATVLFLSVLKSNCIPIFDSVDIRNAEIYRKSADYSAMWMIDKFTLVVYEMRPIISKKQRKYDRALSLTIFGLVLCMVSVMFQKIGV